MSQGLDVARDFVRAVTEGDPPNPAELIALLDRLAQSYHDCPPGEVHDESYEPPKQDRPGAYKLIASRFPTLGLYATADPSVTVDKEPLVADAIDDLADMVGDLRDAIATYDAVGADDGGWLFRFTYQSHWGEHLRRLALYLHVNYGWDLPIP